MRPQINLITILADDGPALAAWYRDVLGFQPLQGEVGVYTEFEHEGVRFSVCARSELVKVTQHPSFSEPRRGQSVELAFEVDHPDDVAPAYEEIIAKGATPITPSADMPWGQRTAFFADPEGNIHEIFANPPD